MLPPPLPCQLLRGNGTAVHSRGAVLAQRGWGALLPQGSLQGLTWCLMLLLCLVPVQLPERLELRTVLPHNLIPEGVEFTVLQFQQRWNKKKLYFSNFGL